MTSARSLWWHVAPYFWPADLTRTANPILSQVSVEPFIDTVTVTLSVSVTVTISDTKWQCQQGCMELCKKNLLDSPANWTGNPLALGQITGASHASHLGDCSPSAYTGRVLYIKKTQVWKSRSETDWPHLEITPDFSTEKNRSILILTSTCWQEISLSNTIELTTVIPQKQKICHFKRHFCRFSKIPEVPLSAYVQQIPWCAMIGGFVFTYVPISVWQPADVRKNKTAQLWCVTGFAAHRQTMERLEFLKTGKKRRMKQQIICFCGMTVVSSTVFEREISCQHVDVKMRMLRFFSVEKSGVISRWVDQFLIGSFTPVSSLHITLYQYRPMDSNCPSD